MRELAIRSGDQYSNDQAGTAKQGRSVSPADARATDDEGAQGGGRR